MPASDGSNALRSSGMNRSATSTRHSTPVTTSSGASACQSMVGRSKASAWASNEASGASAANTASATHVGDPVGHRGHLLVGHVEHEVGVDADHQDEDQH